MRKNNLWTQYAREYDNLSLFSSYRKLLISISDRIKKISPSPKEIIEIGCGTGNLMVYLRKSFPSARITGVEKNPEMLARAARKLDGYNNVKLVLQDACKYLEQCSIKYDVVIMNNVLYILDDKEQILKEIQSVLNDSSILVISDPVPPGSYSYKAIINSDLRNIKTVSKLILKVPSLIKILTLNKKIDKNYNRLSEEEYLKLFSKLAYQMVEKDKAYSNQANLFVLKK